MATPAERRAAQRRLAHEIHTGTFKPSNVGTRARKVATEKEREPLANNVMSHVISILEPAGATDSPINRDRLERNIYGDELLQKVIGKPEFYATIGLPNTKQYPGMSITDLRKALTMSADEWRNQARQDALAGKKRSPFFYK